MMHMQIPMVLKSIVAFISLLLLLSTLPRSQCEQQHPKNYSVCMNEFYNCGTLRNISYPFWGQNRPSYCGAHNLFSLQCHDNQTTAIKIGIQDFIVKDINTNNYTIKMVRTDLNVCSSHFDSDVDDTDTWLNDHTFFRYPDPQRVQNITIFFNCFSINPHDGNSFTCARHSGGRYGKINGTYCWGEADAELFAENPWLLNCAKRIQEPVKAPLVDSVAPYDGVGALRKALGEEFEMHYVVSQECLTCLQSGGLCGTNGTAVDPLLNQFNCYCSHGSIAALSCSISAHNKSKFIWKKKLIIGIIVAGTTGLLITIISCITCKSSTWHGISWLANRNNQDIEAFLRNHGPLAQKRYKFSEVKKMTDSFKVKLGQGGFGAVYKGKLLTGSPVAVKILNASKGKCEDFINEVASISRTSHVNVVTLVGFCLEGRKKALIYEFMPNGSLEKFIYEKGHETIGSLSWEKLQQIAIGIARGLEYLHRGCNTRILHFDIKPHNILLDEDFCPKISDFGLAKLCHKKESIVSMSDPRGTPGYVAPEMWNRRFGGVSHKSDVYSYGMILLDIVEGRKKINGNASHTSEIYFPDRIYKRLEQGNLRPDEVITAEENETAKRMTIVGLWCIQTFPDDRPTISRVIEMLEGSINSLEVPPKPVLSSPTR